MSKPTWTLRSHFGPSRADPGGWQCLHRSSRSGWQPLSFLQRLAPPLMWPYGPIRSLTAGLPKQLPEDVLCKGPEAPATTPHPTSARWATRAARKTPGWNALPPTCFMILCKSLPLSGPQTLPLSNNDVDHPSTPSLCIPLPRSLTSTHTRSRYPGRKTYLFYRHRN